MDGAPRQDPWEPLSVVRYAELHCHSNFSFLDGASPSDDLVERAVELGLSGLAVTDHDGLYGAVRFTAAAQAADLHPTVGTEIGLLDPAVADPDAARVDDHAHGRPPSTTTGSRMVARLDHDRSAPDSPAIAIRSRRISAASARRPAGRGSSCSPGTRWAGAA